MVASNIRSAGLAALIALPMYYMFFSMFSHGFETSIFIGAVIIAAVTFLVTFSIAYLVGRSHQKA